jgi:hypothetical protein
MTKIQFILAMSVLAAVPARANSLLIALDSPVLTGAPGQTVRFFGTITNTTANTVFLNGDNFNLSVLPLSVIDDSPFFLNAPLTLDGGGTSGDIELFDIAIPIPFSAGSYDGMFEVVGGADTNDGNTVGGASFTVQVQPAGGAPEPSTAVLLLAGLCWILARKHYRGLTT